jgi:phage baseplate assembly protein gpV
VKVNRIELDKTQGLTIQVLNGVKQQTIFLDGDKLTITVRGPGGTSTIEQTPTSVTVTADTVRVTADQFIVNARTITETAAIEAMRRSGASSVLMSPASVVTVAPEISLLGEANVNLTAPTITAEAEAVFNVASPGVIALEGGDVSIAGASGVQIEGPTIALMGAVALPLL